MTTTARLSDEERSDAPILAQEPDEPDTIYVDRCVIYTLNATRGASGAPDMRAASKRLQQMARHPQNHHLHMLLTDITLQQVCWQAVRRCMRRVRNDEWRVVDAQLHATVIDSTLTEPASVTDDHEISDNLALAPLPSTAILTPPSNRTTRGTGQRARDIYSALGESILDRFLLPKLGIRLGDARMADLNSAIAYCDVDIAGRIRTRSLLGLIRRHVLHVSGDDETRVRDVLDDADVQRLMMLSRMQDEEVSEWLAATDKLTPLLGDGRRKGVDD